MTKSDNTLVHVIQAHGGNKQQKCQTEKERCWWWKNAVSFPTVTTEQADTCIWQIRYI